MRNIDNGFAVLAELVEVIRFFDAGFDKFVAFEKIWAYVSWAAELLDPRLAELAPAGELRRAPRHPYTQGLLRAFPSVRGGTVELASIPGTPPSLSDPPPGCRFHPRCPLAVDLCRTREPELRRLAPGHSAACHLAK